MSKDRLCLDKIEINDYSNRLGTNVQNHNLIISDPGCDTLSHRKTSTNNTCACAIILEVGLTYDSAVDRCQQLDAQLPEIMNAQENDAIFNIISTARLFFSLEPSIRLQKPILKLFSERNCQF